MHGFEIPEKHPNEVLTIGGIVRAGVQIKAVCLKCRNVFKCDCRSIVSGNGPYYSLLDQFGGCRLFDCKGRVFFMYWSRPWDKWVPMVTRSFMRYRKRWPQSKPIVMPYLKTSLQEFHETPYRITAHCSHGPECTHYMRLDLAKLIDSLGGDFDVGPDFSYLRKKLKCEKCGESMPKFSFEHVGNSGVTASDTNFGRD